MRSAAFSMASHCEVETAPCITFEPEAATQLLDLAERLDARLAQELGA